METSSLFTDNQPQQPQYLIKSLILKIKSKYITFCYNYLQSIIRKEQSPINPISFDGLDLHTGPTFRQRENIRLRLLNLE